MKKADNPDSGIIQILGTVRWLLTIWSGWHRLAGSSQTCPPPSWAGPDRWMTCGDKRQDQLNLHADSRVVSTLHLSFRPSNLDRNNTNGVLLQICYSLLKWRIFTQQDRIIFSLQPRSADVHMLQMQRSNQPPVVFLLRTLPWKHRPV